MLPTLAPTISAAGISAPSYDAILADLREQFQAIFGADAYIAEDSQDGQWLAVQAAQINDANQAIIAAYNAYSPTYAQGNGLSSVVKINGIARKIPSNSTATGNVVGVAGTLVENGVVSDTNGNRWLLPASVTIPLAGTIAVTVTAESPGAVVAASGTINTIETPTFGWQSFLSTTDAVPGQPVESDAALRQRQTSAAALPAITNLGAVVSALEKLEGVTRVAAYENATSGVDANGLTARTICLVVEGGDAQEIGETIGQKKAPGVGTYATGGTAVAVTYVDPITGIQYTINFFPVDYTTAPVEVFINTGNGWSTAIETQIKQAVSDYISGLPIGSDVILARLFAPAYLNGAAGNTAYEITSIEINGAATDFAIAFNKAAKCDPSDVTITP